LRRTILVSLIAGAALIVGLGISAQAQSGHPAAGSVSKLFVKVDTAHESSKAVVSAHVTTTGEVADSNDAAEAAEPTATHETEPADTDIDTQDAQDNQDEIDANDDNGDNSQSSSDGADSSSGADD